MAKRKIKKMTKRRLTVFGTASILAIVYFLFTLSCQIYNLYQLDNKKKELNYQYHELKEKAEDLKIEINQLNDPEYLAKYARENYSYSKEGEYIIKLQEKEKSIKKVEHKMNKEYIIIGLSIFLVILFLYVIGRGRKKNK